MPNKKPSAGARKKLPAQNKSTESGPPAPNPYAENEAGLDDEEILRLRRMDRVSAAIKAGVPYTLSDDEDEDLQFS